MDPLVFILPELHDWIFQHWNANDFEKTTEVTRTWSETLGKSLKMMQNVKLSLNITTIPHHYRLNALKLSFRNSPFREVSFEIENIIDNSTRRYRKVSVNFTLTKFFKYKLFKYLATLGPKLLELELACLGLLSEEDENILSEIDLSKLEKLSLRTVTAEVMNNLLDRCNSLTTLELKSIHVKYNRPSIAKARSFLKRNESLEHLELASKDIYEAFFGKDISQIINFKLKSLKLGDWFCNFQMPQAVERNVLKFLEKQAQSLEHLHLTKFNSNVLIEHFFNRLPALTSLAIFSRFDTADLKLNQNENIVELEIPEFERTADFEKIIRAVPKLQRLFTLDLTPEKLHMIARSLSELRKIQYRYSMVEESDSVWNLFCLRANSITFEERRRW